MKRFWAVLLYFLSFLLFLNFIISGIPSVYKQIKIIESGNSGEIAEAMGSISVDLIVLFITGILIYNGRRLWKSPAKKTEWNINILDDIDS